MRILPPVLFVGVGGRHAGQLASEREALGITSFAACRNQRKGIDSDPSDTKPAEAHRQGLLLVHPPPAAASVPPQVAVETAPHVRPRHPVPPVVPAKQMGQTRALFPCDGQGFGSTPPEPPIRPLKAASETNASLVGHDGVLVPADPARNVPYSWKKGGDNIQLFAAKVQQIIEIEVDFTETVIEGCFKPKQRGRYFIAIAIASKSLSLPAIHPWGCSVRSGSVLWEWPFGGGDNGRTPHSTPGVWPR